MNALRVQAAGAVRTGKTIITHRNPRLRVSLAAILIFVFSGFSQAFSAAPEAIKSGVANTTASTLVNRERDGHGSSQQATNNGEPRSNSDAKGDSVALGSDRTSSPQAIDSTAVHFADAIAHDVWVHYFTTLAETVAVSAALLLAFGVFRLEMLANTLLAIERCIAEAFYRIDEDDAYTALTADHFLGHRWEEYFGAVDILTTANTNGFSGDQRYTESEGYVRSLIARGQKLSERAGRLERGLKSTAVLAVTLAGFAAGALPLVMRTPPQYLWPIWGVCTLLFLVLITSFLRILSMSSAHK